MPSLRISRGWLLLASSVTFGRRPPESIGLLRMNSKRLSLRTRCDTGYIRDLRNGGGRSRAQTHSPSHGSISDSGDCAWRIRYGISQSRDRARYEQWLAEHLLKFRILDIDERTTVSYGAIRAELRKAGTPIPSNDTWIAALCLQHSLPLISRDRHFDHVSGVTRIS